MNRKRDRPPELALVEQDIDVEIHVVHHDFVRVGVGMSVAFGGLSAGRIEIWGMPEADRCKTW